MKGTEEQVFRRYSWVIIVLVIIVSVFIVKNKKNKQQEGTIDNSSITSQSTETNREEGKFYYINPNHILIGSVPNKDIDLESYNKVHNDAVKILEKNGFAENEINFDKGISYSIIEDNKLVGYRMEWYISKGCKLIIKYNEDYVVKSSLIGCR